MMVATYELSGPPREQKAPVPDDANDGDLNSIFDAEKVFHAGLNSEQLLKVSSRYLVSVVFISFDLPR